MKKKVQYKHSGGYQLKQMREREGWLQRKLAYELDIAESMISRFETGARVPNRELLEKILGKLQATPFERKNVLNAYGYRVITELPTDEELKSACDNVRVYLDSLDIPAYLMDCTTRVIAWNHYISRAFGLPKPEQGALSTFDPRPAGLLRAISSVPLIKSFYSYNIKDMVGNWDDLFFNGILGSVRSTLWEYKDTDWCKNLIDEVKAISPEFKTKWEKIEEDNTISEWPVVGRPVSPFIVSISHLEFPLTFKAAAETLIKDDRFRIIYWHPANIETMQKINEWAELHQQALAEQSS